MKRYFITLAYNGKNYCGWQIQPNGLTVQQKLEEALSVLLRQPVAVTGAGRTDSGVHARSMTAHFDGENVDCSLLSDRLNRILPADMAVMKIEEVHSHAHARFDALSRTYKYYLSTKKDPFNRDMTYRVFYVPDLDRMNEAALTLFDYADFTSFSKLHTDVKTNNCVIMFARWEQENELLVFTVKADRFLRNMVRAVVGTLLDVGRGKLSVEDFRRIIESKDRCRAGVSVPGHALFLTDIEYPTSVFIK
jgi:pseudouridylate synthase I